MKDFKPTFAYISQSKNVYRNKNDICEMIVSDIKQCVRLCSVHYGCYPTLYLTIQPSDKLKQK